MPGEPELFYIHTSLETTTTSGGVTLTTTEDISDSWYATQALADAAAHAAGVGVHAHNGAVSIPNGWEKGWIRNRDDGTWRQLAVSDLDELGQRKNAAMILHDALIGWENGVLEVRHEKPTIDVNRAFDFLCYGHWANYIVFTNANDTWTAAQQIAWAFAMTAGAADITTVQEFFQNAHMISEAEVPQEACAWVNPNDAVAVDTAACPRKLYRWTTDCSYAVVRRRRDRPDDDHARQRRMDRGHHLMLPTLGQLITPTTDVTVDENYELIVILDTDGSRRVIERYHFGPTFHCRAFARGLRIGSHRLLGTRRLAGILSSAQSCDEGWYSPVSAGGRHRHRAQPKPRSTRCPTSRTS